MASSTSHNASRIMPLAPHQYLGPLLIFFVSLFAYIFEQQLESDLVYQRQEVMLGEWWRYISAHFFHTNLYHFMLNAAALILLWALQGQRYSFFSFLFVFFFSAISACLGVHYFSPELKQYVGLSGALHGIFIWGALLEISHKEKTGYLLLLGLLMKIAFEQFYGASEDVSALINAKVAINSHLWGAIGGFIMSLLLMLTTAKSSKRHS